MLKDSLDDESPALWDLLSTSRSGKVRPPRLDLPYAGQACKTSQPAQRPDGFMSHSPVVLCQYHFCLPSVDYAPEVTSQEEEGVLVPPQFSSWPLFAPALSSDCFKWFLCMIDLLATLWGGHDHYPHFTENEQVSSWPKSWAAGEWKTQGLNLWLTAETKLFIVCAASHVCGTGHLVKLRVCYRLR